MRKQIFTVMAACCSLVMVNAADQTVAANGDIAAAITAAAGDGIVRVEVGTYVLAAELNIPNGVTVRGGYPVGSLFDDTKRIYPGAATDKADMTILDGNSLVNTTAKHRVATVAGTLEGVVIRNGHAHNTNGGGVLVKATGIVQNCIIKGNVAMNPTTNKAEGGGAYLEGGRLINCVVAYNMANNGYGVAGTGEVINNTITANTFAPAAVALPATTDFIHFAHSRDAGTPSNPMTAFDSQTIELSAFHLAETETTTGQFAVFAAAMDLTGTTGDATKYKFATSLNLGSLADPLGGGTVINYMGNTGFDDAEVVLFQANQTGYGLQAVGSDFIYPATKANQAMTFVTWHGALAYSLWIGGTLPTEAQWEYAARYNGAGVDTYPYAGNADFSVVGWGNNSGLQEVATKTGNGVNLFDMSGNVWEWCADRYEGAGDIYPDYTSNLISTFQSLTDPINNVKGSDRVRRGGGWNNAALSLAYRLSTAPPYMVSPLGFRPVLVP